MSTEISEVLSSETLGARLLVHNVRHRPAAGFTSVYVGHGSVLGNPYRVTRTCSHGEAAVLYLHWLNRQGAQHGPVRRALLDLARRIGAGEHLALGCWCSPQVCHAHHIMLAVIRHAGWLHVHEARR